MVGAHGAQSDATEGQIVLHIVEQGVVDRHSAACRARQDMSDSAAVIAEM
jgi:hypothetical protein